MIRWDVKRHSRAWGGELAVSIPTSHSPSTLTTCSEILTRSVRTTIFTNTRRGVTSRTTSRTSRERPTAVTGDSSRAPLHQEDYLTTSSRTWRGCSHSTCQGRTAGSTVPQNSTAELWPRGEGTWWPHTLTAPKASRDWMVPTCPRAEPSAGPRHLVPCLPACSSGTVWYKP